MRQIYTETDFFYGMLFAQFQLAFICKLIVLNEDARFELQILWM